MAMLLAASVTPLRDGGAALDEAAIAPMVDFLAAGGVDGLFALGTTGEGVLLSLEERMRAAVVFREACGGTLILHSGAQSTADTVALAAPARRSAPTASPSSRRRTTRSGPTPCWSTLPRPPRPARRCRSTPTPSPPGAATGSSRRSSSGCATVPRTSPASRCRRRRSTAWRPTSSSAAGLHRLGAAHPAGPRRRCHGIGLGPRGGLPVVAAVVRAPDETGAARLRELRDAIERHPFQAALKAALAARSVPVSGDVRAPLDRLDADGVAAMRGLATACFFSCSPVLSGSSPPQPSLWPVVFC